VELLKQLNDVYPNSISFEELHKREFSSKVIHDAYLQGVIISSYPIEVQQKTPLTFMIYSDKGDYQFWISVKGFELLTQMDIKTALGGLDRSIVKFNVSSDSGSNTIAILTVLLVILAILQIMPDISIMGVSLKLLLLVIIAFCLISVEYLFWFSRANRKRAP